MSKIQKQIDSILVLFSYLIGYYMLRIFMRDTSHRLAVLLGH
jgi:hypothetical protein